MLRWKSRLPPGRPSTTEDLEQIAIPVALSCPSCSGVLSQASEPSRLRLRCQIGHAYHADVLNKQQEAAIAEAIGTALLILEERHTLLVRLAANASPGNELSAKQYQEKAQDYRRQAHAPQEERCRQYVNRRPKRDPLSASKRDPFRCDLCETMDVSLFG
jgi:two-component system chemotaxis response regulator CheB